MSAVGRAWPVAALTMVAYFVFVFVARQPSGEWQLPAGFLVALLLVVVAHGLAALRAARRPRWFLLAPAIGAAQVVLGTGLLLGIELASRRGPEPGVERVGGCPEAGSPLCPPEESGYGRMLEVPALLVLLAAGFGLGVAGVARRARPTAEAART